CTLRGAAGSPPAPAPAQLCSRRQYGDRLFCQGGRCRRPDRNQFPPSLERFAAAAVDSARHSARWYKANFLHDAPSGRRTTCAVRVNRLIGPSPQPQRCYETAPWRSYKERPNTDPTQLVSLRRVTLTAYFTLISRCKNLTPNASLANPIFGRSEPCERSGDFSRSRSNVG